MEIRPINGSDSKKSKSDLITNASESKLEREMIDPLVLIQIQLKSMSDPFFLSFLKSNPIINVSQIGYKKGA